MTYDRRYRAAAWVAVLTDRETLVGRMQAALEVILRSAGKISRGEIRFPHRTDITHDNQAEIVNEVYRKLGGMLPVPELHLRPWDIEFDGVAIELDESLHFNRYRASTLESKAYAELPGFPLDLYRRYCALHEGACLKAGGYGGKWSNKSCERQFGTPGSPQDLVRGGAPRWKQRAFYDFVKDLSPLLIGVRVVRIAIWDKVPETSGKRTVADILQRPSYSVAATQDLVELVRNRCVSSAPLV